MRFYLYIRRVVGCNFKGGSKPMNAILFSETVRQPNKPQMQSEEKYKKEVFFPLFNQILKY